MIIVLIPWLACKSKTEKDNTLPEPRVELALESLRSWTGTAGSRFGTSLQYWNDTLWISAPDDCEHTLYQVTNDTLSPVQNHSNCAGQEGHQMLIGPDDLWLYTPLPSPSWQSLSGEIINGRRMAWLEGVPHWTTDSTVQSADSNVAFTENIQDLTVHKEQWIALLNGTLQSIVTSENSDSPATLDSLVQSPRLYTLHHDDQPLTIIGGGQRVYTWVDDQVTALDIDPTSILGRDQAYHPHVSIGYAGVLTDIDGDGYLDWFIGAPTAGSGQTSSLEEHAGWVGWFEQIDNTWQLQREWTGTEAFAHFGWSLVVLSTSTRFSIAVGAPNQGTVTEIIGFEPTPRAQ